MDGIPFILFSRGLGVGFSVLPDSKFSFYIVEDRQPASGVPSPVDL